MTPKSEGARDYGMMPSKNEQSIKTGRFGQQHKMSAQTLCNINSHMWHLMLTDYSQMNKRLRAKKYCFTEG